MMDFIENNQFKGIAILSHQVARGVISGNGQRQHTLLSAIIHSYIGSKGIDKARIPLVEQINSRRNYNRGAIDAVYGLDGEECFARAGW